MSEISTNPKPPASTGSLAKRALSWHDYAEALLPTNIEAYLDYGCGRGLMLRRISPRAARTCGVDVDPDVIPSVPGAETCVIREGQPLPFPDRTFDVITCLEVIEHVSNERQTLSELARVLRPGGTLVLTTPHKGWLTWMDPGNLKFVFPRLHKLAHTLLGNKKYEAQFGNVRREKLGMISDISANRDRPWHRHYSYEEIRALADDSLETVHVETVYPGMRALWYVLIPWRQLFHREPEWLKPIASRLSRWRTTGGDQLVISFRKSETRSSPQAFTTGR